MSEHKCRACGGTFRTGRKALILTEEGLEGAIVCQPCADGGVLLVPVKPTRHALELAGAHELAQRKTQRDHLAPFVANIEAKLRAHKAAWTLTAMPRDDEFQRGRMETWEAMLAMLREGRA